MQQQTNPVEVQIKVLFGDKVVKTFSAIKNDSRDIRIEVAQIPQLPDRSPLHPQALNLKDMKPGLRIKRINIRSRSNHSTGIILAKPFRYGDKFSDCESVSDSLVVPVAMISYGGELITDNWFLGDIGVDPYRRSNGTAYRWNEQNYTLKAE